MALITDPDQLNQGTEITIDTAARTFDLPIAGNLSDDGVSGQGLFSFFKEEWKSDASLIAYPFPVVSITPEQFEFVEDWEPANDATRNKIRSAGWREITAAGALKREYMGLISLPLEPGSIKSDNTPHYAFSSDAAKTDFDFTAEVNQAIQTFGDSANGDFDKRSDSLTLYIRSQGNTYGSATSASLALTELNYIANRFPLFEESDSKIKASDSDIVSNAPYTGMTITYGAVTRLIGGVSYNFDVVVDGNNGTLEQIYEFVQYKLRQTTDIDDGSGTQVGVLADSLMGFKGDKLVTTTGCFIDRAATYNPFRVGFTDTADDLRSFPFVAEGNLVPNSILAADADSFYRMFFADGYGTESARLVNDNSGNPISGNVSARLTIPWNFDFGGNVQGGRTPGTPCAVKVVFSGLNVAQYSVADHVIEEATGQIVRLTAGLERNYSNA